MPTPLMIAGDVGRSASNFYGQKANILDTSGVYSTTDNAMNINNIRELRCSSFNNITTIVMFAIDQVFRWYVISLCDSGNDELSHAYHITAGINLALALLTMTLFGLRVCGARCIEDFNKKTANIRNNLEQFKSNLHFDELDDIDDDFETQQSGMDNKK